MLGEIGDVSRFPNPEKLIKYAGYMREFISPPQSKSMANFAGEISLLFAMHSLCLPRKLISIALTLLLTILVIKKKENTQPVP